MARYVKTVNIHPSIKTVGVYKHPNRLRWIYGNINSIIKYDTDNNTVIKYNEADIIHKLHPKNSQRELYSRTF